MFVVGARLGMPVVAVVLRKAYGMGTMAMAASGLHAPLATAAWPSGEFEALGLEGGSSSAIARNRRARRPVTSATSCANVWSPNRMRRARH